MTTPGLGARTLHGIPDEPEPTHLTVAHHVIAGNVLAELNRAIKAFPPMNTAHEGYAILREEVDELWDEVKANRPDRAIAEAYQVAAMAIRFIHDMQDGTKA